MLNPDSVGSTFGGTETITVTQSEIDAFCAVIGETDTSIAPPTFTIRITLSQFEEILTRPEIGLDWTRLVHGDQKFQIFFQSDQVINSTAALLSRAIESLPEMKLFLCAQIWSETAPSLSLRGPRWWCAHDGNR